MKIADFFGFNLDRSPFVLEDYLAFGRLGQRVDRSPAVQQAIDRVGSREHGYVRILRRREVLRLLGPLIRSDFLPWNKYYYLKEVNTATEEDRLYGAEEAFLAFCLVLATGQSWPALQAAHFQPGLRVLRNMKPVERDLALQEIFHEYTAEAEQAYRQRLGLNHSHRWRRWLGRWLGRDAGE